MRDFWFIMKRFLPPYKHLLVFNILFNLLSALFAVFSVALMIPMLEIILGQQSEVYALADWNLNFNDLKHNLYYYITQLKNNYGPGWSLLFVGVFLVFGTLLKTGFAYLASYTSVGIRNGVVRDLRYQIYRKILNLHSGFFSEEKKGDIIARSTGDVQEVENSIMSSLDMFLKNPVLIMVYLAAMLIFSVKLTLFVFVVLPLAGYIIGRVGRSLKKTSREGQNKMGDLLGIIEETLSGLRIIKAFNAEKRMDHRFNEEIEEYRSIMNRLMRRRDLAHPMSEFLGTIVVVILVWFGGTLILTESDTLNAAQFLAYLGIFYQVINPAKAFSKALYNIQKGLAAFDRIDGILNAEVKIKESPNAKPINELKQGIEYRNVTFAYNKTPVLKNISLYIPKGKTIALVGQSGSGKSTFVDLLPRFYDVSEGAILIDGIDIRDLKIHDLRHLMGNVNQDAILFNDTIFNNIAFGVENATPEQVEEAARVANAHDFIMATEHGYDTIAGDRGGRLSGGQRQRISIARAVLKNPPILILDEATSALDTESEKLVQEALENLMANRTSIVIAHRLSTVRNADCIYVFHDGEIVETGDHHELIEKRGVYQKLHELQMR
ncbi:MAG: ATP-binding cassette, subfamily bacterial MsbA [Anaerophaga sp.]|uniref:ABC transporter ATP-binding protein n=1 Tax=Anaerophaga thermohalophila TaxID=177400 RepID=UPI000237C6EA|nr:ABC transporter ATP-binding protein [Anaerophaga thermohalophila]MDK2842288.1 ATP-binding cassette, subfamily bacterial MsbA [Anaerophaga sp.]MDN5291330.1 ATP-binding cassette, subfamily bacterial MsbA [Anaerophaga sp.]